MMPNSALRTHLCKINIFSMASRAFIVVLRRQSHAASIVLQRPVRVVEEDGNNILRSSGSHDTASQRNEPLLGVPPGATVAPFL